MEKLNVSRKINQKSEIERKELFPEKKTCQNQSYRKSDKDNYNIFL